MLAFASDLSKPAVLQLLAFHTIIHFLLFVYYYFSNFSPLYIQTLTPTVPNVVWAVALA